MFRDLGVAGCPRFGAMKFLRGDKHLWGVEELHRGDRPRRNLVAVQC